MGCRHIFLLGRCSHPSASWLQQPHRRSDMIELPCECAHLFLDSVDAAGVREPGCVRQRLLAVFRLLVSPLAQCRPNFGSYIKECVRPALAASCGPTPPRGCVANDSLARRARRLRLQVSIDLSHAAASTAVMPSECLPRRARPGGPGQRRAPAASRWVRRMRRRRTRGQRRGWRPARRFHWQ